MIGSSRIWDTLSWISILLLVIFALFPVYWMVNTSLKPLEEVFLSKPTFVSPNWSFESYLQVWETRPLLVWFVNSAIISLGSTALAMTLSALAAYGFSRFRMRLEGPMIILLLFTQMLPGTLLIIPYFQLMANVGLVDTYGALILAYTSFALPFSTWMLIGFFRSIPTDLDEAAMVDGCTRVSAFFRVILPLSLPGMVAVGTFTFLTSWNSYVYPLVLTTSPKMYPLSVGITNMVGEYQVFWNELMAAVVMAAIPVVIMYSFLEKYLVQGITAGAVKG